MFHPSRAWTSAVMTQWHRFSGFPTPYPGLPVTFAHGVLHWSVEIRSMGPFLLRKLESCLSIPSILRITPGSTCFASLSNSVYIHIYIITAWLKLFYYYYFFFVNRTRCIYTFIIACLLDDKSTTCLCLLRLRDYYFFCSSQGALAHAWNNLLTHLI